MRAAPLEWLSGFSAHLHAEWAARLREETGIEIAGSDLSLYDVMNGLDGTLVVFGLAAKQPLACLKPFTSAETQEVVLIEKPIELGFSMHTRVVRRFFAEAGMVSAQP
jgi:hypothetical protein